jgi:hypothetical protein
MGEVNQPYDLMSRMKDLERQVDEIRKRVGLGNATISNGSLKVLHPNGVAIAQFGKFTIAGATAYGWILRRPDGSIVTYTYGTDDLQGLSAWFDKTGNTIIADDGVSGVGLARPYIPIPFYDDDTVALARTTTSASFVKLGFGKWNKQHPKLVALALVRSSAVDTTGEVRLTAGGNVVGAVQSIAGNEFAYKDIGPGDAPGTFGIYYDLQIEARRTAGTGTIGVRVMGCHGVQS